jgi:hypothetical protein
MSSKRKYNPNKLINIQRAKAGLLYEFDMTFCIEDVNRKIDAYREANVLADDAYCPEWLVIETYEQQDLIIALKMSQVKNPEYWEIAIASHFINEDATDVKTIDFYVELPEMSHAELMNGCEVKVNRGAGIKTRWKGLQDEMIKNWETETMPDDYSLVESQVLIKAQARFHDIKMYNEHNLLLKLRDHGNLIDTLKRLV